MPKFNDPRGSVTPHKADQPSIAVRRLSQEGPRNGVATVRPVAVSEGVTASWPQLEPDAIAEAVRSAGVQSSRKLDKAVTADDDRRDFGPGFRDSVEELRREIKADTHAQTATQAATQTDKLTRSAGRRI